MDAPQGNRVQSKRSGVTLRGFLRPLFLSAIFWALVADVQAQQPEEFEEAAGEQQGEIGYEAIRLPDYGMQQIERGEMCDGKKYRCEPLVGGVLVCIDLAAWDQIHRASQVGARAKIAADLTAQAIEQGRCFVSEPQVVEVHPNPYAHTAPGAAFVVFPEDRVVKSSTGLVTGYFVEREAVTRAVEAEQ
jgi:hypothetical protein